MRVPRAYSRVGTGLCALLMGVSLLLSVPVQVAATGAPQGDLVLREVDITGDDFIVLQANTAIAHASDYWLGYTSTDTETNLIPDQQLPDVSLAVGQSILLNYGSSATCDASYVAKLSFALSNTSGALEVRRLDNIDDRTSQFTTIDRVNWDKPSASGLASDNIDLRQESGLQNPVWYKNPATASASWQAGNMTDCILTIVDPVPGTPPQTVTWQQADSSPPSVVVADSSVAGSASNAPSIPSSDIGLKPPELSEILPNPASPKTDANDEFIELYNPNGASFDLSGFQLQIASSTSAETHSYTFPAGTILGGKSFKAFYSAQTNLGLNNNGGQVWLIDPLGTVVGQSNAYGTAKDGLAWVNAGGKWQWTAEVSPGETNTLAAVIGASTTKSTSKTSSKTPVSASGASTSSNADTSTAGSATTADVTPIHPWVLVAVVVAALLYGAYEYRIDLANRLYQFRRYRASRRDNRG